MIPDSEISECADMKSNQKQETYLSMEKYSNNILSGFIKLILIFMSITGKKTEVDENRGQYILFRIDVYFIEYILAVEIDKKGHTDRTLFLRRKDKKKQK